MDWTEYKRLCDRPQVMSRHLLARSAEILSQAGDSALASRIQGVSDGDSLMRPLDHRGDARSHMFLVRFTQREVDQVLRALARIEAPDGKVLTAAWREYRDSLKEAS